MARTLLHRPREVHRNRGRRFLLERLEERTAPSDSVAGLAGVGLAAAGRDESPSSCRTEVARPETGLEDTELRAPLERRSLATILRDVGVDGDDQQVAPGEAGGRGMQGPSGEVGLSATATDVVMTQPRFNEAARWSVVSGEGGAWAASDLLSAWRPTTRDSGSPAPREHGRIEPLRLRSPQQAAADLALGIAFGTPELMSTLDDSGGSGGSGGGCSGGDPDPSLSGGGEYLTWTGTSIVHGIHVSDNDLDSIEVSQGTYVTSQLVITFDGRNDGDPCDIDEVAGYILFTPIPGSPGTDVITITAYSAVAGPEGDGQDIAVVTIETYDITGWDAQERAWGEAGFCAEHESGGSGGSCPACEEIGWHAPEDGPDLQNGIDGTVLWTVNEHRWQVFTDPANILYTDPRLADLEIEWYRMTWEDYNDPSIDKSVLSNWEEGVAGELGKDYAVKPRIAYSQAWEGAPKRFFMAQVASMEWEPADWSRTIQNEQGQDIHVAELRIPNDAPELTDFYHDEWRVYPTFTTAPRLDEARVKVTTSAIPPGLKGTIHLNWYDPEDKQASDGVNIVDHPQESWSVENAAAGASQDNRVGLSFLLGTQTLVFSDDPNYTTSNVRKAILEFPGECFGDNFIVAAHPNSGIQNTYTFAVDHETLQYEASPDGSKADLGDALETSTLYAAAWNGFKVPAAWKYDEAEYTIETHAPTGFYDTQTGKYYPKDHPNPQGDAAYAPNEGPNAVSVLKCPDGFDLTVDYEFDHDQGGDFGYVHAVQNLQGPAGDGTYTGTLREKISFVGNSGVKFGGKEVQILDVKAMVQRVDGGNPPELVQSWADSVFSTAINDQANVSGIGQNEAENLGRLLTGIVYGDRTLRAEWDKVKDYANAALDADGNPLNNTPRESYFNTLTNNYNRGNTSLTIDIAAADVSADIEVDLDGSESFKDSGFVLASQIGNVEIQGHWGSGVVFTDASLTPKPNPGP